MYIYLKVIFNKLSQLDLLAIRSGMNIINKKYRSHQIYLEELYIELEKSYLHNNRNLLSILKNERYSNNRIISQYFSKSFNNFIFTKVILISIARKKKVSLPIPIYWYKYFENKGIKISKIGCFSLFFLQGFSKIFLGLKELVKVFNYNFILRNNKNHIFDNFFFNPIKENFPLNSNFNDYSLFSELVNKNIIKKLDRNLIYIKNKKTINSINIIIKKLNLNFFVTTIDYPAKLNFLKFCKIFTYSIYLFFYTILNILLMRLEILNFFDEIIRYQIVKSSDHTSFPRNIFFNNSNWKYKPLWTYIVEEKGSNVSVYFYSLSESGYKSKTKTFYDIQGLHNLCWKNYYTWNDNHTNFLKKITKEEFKFFQLGSISFKDSSLESLNDISFKNTIAVFDAAPYKESFSSYFAMESSKYRSYKNILDFIYDITNICKEMKINIIYKSKKNDSNQISKYFLNKINEVKKVKNFTEINHNISPKNYIDKCICSINYPFTSTAHLSSNTDKSIFYDPTGSIFLDDPSSHGIKVINQREILKKFISDIREI